MATGDGVIVVGGGGHARAVLDAIRAEGRYQVVGILDSLRPRGTPHLGTEVLGDLDALEQAVRTGAGSVVVAIGDNWQRRAVSLKVEALAPGLAFGCVVHPSATVAPDVALGPGTVVLPGSVVVSGCAIGRGCIVNTLASLDHDGTLEDYASLAPGAIVGGRVHVGTCAAIGLGAHVIQKRRIGPHALVGAGSLVLEDVPAQVVAFGSPARVVRPRAVDEPYL